LDDCWPVASWSSIDYFGRWKALQYYARRFYSPLLVSPHAEGDGVNLYVVSDRARPTPARLVASLLDFDGHTLAREARDVTVAGLRGDSYLSLPLSELLHGRDPKRLFLLAELLVGGRVVSSNEYFFRPFKELSLPTPRVGVGTVAIRGGFRLTLSTDKLARDVYLSAEAGDGRFSDNFFDLIPGRPLTVEFRTSRRDALEAFRKRLKVRSLVEAFR
jgi:beta-mannosidase